MIWIAIICALGSSLIAFLAGIKAGSKLGVDIAKAAIDETASTASTLSAVLDELPITVEEANAAVERAHIKMKKEFVRNIIDGLKARDQGQA